MRFYKRITAALLTLVIVLLLTACGSSPLDILNDGAEQFADGKPEEHYYLKNSGTLLDELIKKYSGSYQRPSSVQIDPDPVQPDPTDPTDATADPGDPSDPTDATTDPGGDPSDPTLPIPSVVTVGSWEEYTRVFYNAYVATSEHLEFETVNGYTVDMNVQLQEMHDQLQREDPIHASCVKSWTWSVSGDRYTVTITYTMDPGELAALKAVTEDLVDEAVARIDTTGKTDYELICAVNDYLCDHVYYPDSEPYAPVTHTAYGALYNGEAVCEGYACAAKLMLNELGIRCDIQVGTCTNGGGHAWNLVELDGVWYQMDVTWNDGSSDRTDYLLVTDDYMRKSRTWDENDYPACSATPYEH